MFFVFVVVVFNLGPTTPNIVAQKMETQLNIIPITKIFNAYIFILWTAFFMFQSHTVLGGGTFFMKLQ